MKHILPFFLAIGVACDNRLSRVAPGEETIRLNVWALDELSKIPHSEEGPLHFQVLNFFNDALDVLGEKSKKPKSQESSFPSSLIFRELLLVESKSLNQPKARDLLDWATGVAIDEWRPNLKDRKWKRLVRFEPGYPIKVEMAELLRRRVSPKTEIAKALKKVVDEFLEGEGSGQPLEEEGSGKLEKLEELSRRLAEVKEPDRRKQKSTKNDAEWLLLHLWSGDKIVRENYMSEMTPKDKLETFKVFAKNFSQQNEEKYRSLLVASKRDPNYEKMQKDIVFRESSGRKSIAAVQTKYFTEIINRLKGNNFTEELEAWTNFQLFQESNDDKSTILKHPLIKGLIREGRMPNPWVLNLQGGALMESERNSPMQSDAHAQEANRMESERNFRRELDSHAQEANRMESERNFRRELDSLIGRLRRNRRQESERNFRRELDSLIWEWLLEDRVPSSLCELLIRRGRLSLTGGETESKHQKTSESKRQKTSESKCQKMSESKCQKMSESKCQKMSESKCQRFHFLQFEAAELIFLVSVFLIAFLLGKLS